LLYFPSNNRHSLFSGPLSERYISEDGLLFFLLVSRLLSSALSTITTTALFHTISDGIFTYDFIIPTVMDSPPDQQRIDGRGFHQTITFACRQSPEPTVPRSMEIALRIVVDSSTQQQLARRPLSSSTTATTQQRLSVVFVVRAKILVPVDVPNQ
jgi:hypothetical protein